MDEISTKKIIDDDLGPVSLRFNNLNPIFIEKVFRNIDGASKWCDIKHSNYHETCPEIASTSLDEALSLVAGKVWKELKCIKMGDAHEALHRNETLGNLPIIKYLVNIQQSTSGGNNTLMRGKVWEKEMNLF